MGYNSRISGTIPVTPPFHASRLSSQKFLPGMRSQRSVGMGAMFHVEERSITDPVYGTGIALYVAGIVPASDEPIYAFELAKDLDEMAAQVLAAGSCCDVNAYLVRSGEDQGDVERYWFSDVESGLGRTWQTHRKEHAVLRWPISGELVEL
jgi:hypothetical protein